MTNELMPQVDKEEINRVSLTPLNPLREGLGKTAMTSR